MRGFRPALGGAACGAAWSCAGLDPTEPAPRLHRHREGPPSPPRPPHAPHPAPPPPRPQVVSYFQAVAGFTSPEVLLEVKAPGGGAPPPAGRGPLDGLLRPLAALFARDGSDPFYAVVAHRNFKREDR